MFEYFVPVVKPLMLLPGNIAYISGGLSEFPCGITLMVLDFMFQLIDVFQLDVDLVIIVFNLGHGLPAKGTRNHIVKPLPALG